ncbi:MAG: hypothetical protein J7647_09330 [Cyanobacteria bacterium SBLK]|nr:hypothetical protein [Cyanobacteria bacterium SBLK]
MHKPFVGLTPYQIGWPPSGYTFLYLDFDMLANMTPLEALKKLESMGYKPQLRLKETTSGFVTCALLKVVKLDDPSSRESPFEDILDDLHETFEGAIRSPSGHPISIDSKNRPEIAEEELEPIR